MATYNVEVRQRVSGAFTDTIYPKAHWGNIDGKPSTFAPTAHTHDGYAYAAVNDGTSGLWHYTNSDITAYTNGIAVVLLVNNISGSSSGTKFEINNLGSYNIYYTNDSKMTTHYSGYTTIILSWEAARSRWYCHDFYDSTDDYGLRWQNNITFGVLTHGYQVLLEGVDGKYYPVTQGGSTGNTNVVSTASIKPGGKVVYYSSATDQAANANAGAYSIYESHYNGEMEYWNNRDSGWAIAYRPFYFVFTQNADGSLKVDNSTFTSFMTQTLPTTEDGKLYMQIGIMNNTYDTFRLLIDHPIFEYKDGKLRLWVPPHTHAIADVTGLQTALNAKAASSHTHAYASITDKPSTFAPSAHTHGNITNDGKIGTTANLVIQTGTGGALTAKAAGSTSQFLRGDGAWATPEVEGGGGLTFTSIKNWSGNINVGNGGAAVDLPLSENIVDGNKYIIVWTSGGTGMEYMSMFISRASGNISLSYTYGAQNSVHSYGFNISRNLSHLNRFRISGYYDYSLYESFQEFNAGTTNGASFNIVDILKVT